MRPTVTDWSPYRSDRGFLSASEFVCRCDNRCGSNNVDLELIEKLWLARHEYSSAPFVITSGCRCPIHNNRHSRNPNSDHVSSDNMACVGVDIRVRNPRERFIIERALIKAGIDRIGHNFQLNFIHAGIGVRNDKEVIWSY